MKNRAFREHVKLMISTMGLMGILTSFGCPTDNPPTPEDSIYEGKICNFLQGLGDSGETGGDTDGGGGVTDDLDNNGAFQQVVAACNYRSTLIYNVENGGGIGTGPADLYNPSPSCLALLKQNFAINQESFYNPGAGVTTVADGDYFFFDVDDNGVTEGGTRAAELNYYRALHTILFSPLYKPANNVNFVVNGDAYQYPEITEDLGGEHFETLPDFVTTINSNYYNEDVTKYVCERVSEVRFDGVAVGNFTATMGGGIMRLGYGVGGDLSGGLARTVLAGTVYHEVSHWLGGHEGCLTAIQPGDPGNELGASVIVATPPGASASCDDVEGMTYHRHAAFYNSAAISMLVSEVSYNGTDYAVGDESLAAAVMARNCSMMRRVNDPIRQDHMDDLANQQNNGSRPGPAFLDCTQKGIDDVAVFLASWDGPIGGEDETGVVDETGAFGGFIPSTDTISRYELDAVKSERGMDTEEFLTRHREMVRPLEIEKREHQH